MPMIYPTHTCFDDALDFLEELAKIYSAALFFEGYKLVHAVCLMPDGKEFSHAWVEDNHGRAHFFVMVDGVKERVVCDAKEYRKSLRVQEFTEYTPEQACRQNRENGTYGPWLDRYKKLCRNGGKL